MLVSAVAIAFFSIASAAPVGRSDGGIPAETCPRLPIGGPYFAPVPGSCTQYYYCDAFGFDRVYECHYPKVFNPDTGTCVTLPKDVTCKKGKFTTAKSGHLKRSSTSVARRDLFAVPKDDTNEANLETGSKDLTVKDDTKDSKDDSGTAPTKADEKEGPKDDSGVATPNEDKKEDPKDSSVTLPPKGNKDVESSKNPEGDDPTVDNFKFDDQEEIDNYGEGHYYPVDDGHRYRHHRYHSYNHGDDSDHYRQGNGRGHNGEQVGRYEGDERGYNHGHKGGRYKDDDRGYSSDNGSDRYEGDEHGYHDDDERDRYEDTKKGDSDDGQEGDYYEGDDEHM